MDLAQLFIPFLQFTGIYITSFWFGGFTKPTDMNKRNENLGNSIFVHFQMTFLTTLTGILDFVNLIFQTGIFFQFKLEKISYWMFQTEKLLKSQCRQIGGKAYCPNIYLCTVSLVNKMLQKWAFATQFYGLRHPFLNKARLALRHQQPKVGLYLPYLEKIKN